MSTFEREKDRLRGYKPWPGSLCMQAALAKRTGDSAQGENKGWLLIAQCLQKKTLPWGSYSKWLLALVAPRHCASLCKATIFSTLLSLSFLFWPISRAFTLSNHKQTLCSPVDEIPLPPLCTAATSSFPSFFPPFPHAQHHHPVPFATSLYGDDGEVSSGAERDAEPWCCMVRNK